MWAQNWKEGEDVRFTATKDQATVFAFALKWPGEEFRSNVLRPREGSDVVMLGTGQALPWKVAGGELSVEIPAEIARDKPCDFVWCFKIEL
jgi:alpha-L-fucosidase